MTDLLTGRPTTCARVDEVDEPLTCVSITRVTRDVVSFTFELADRVWLRFEPGQYLTFSVDVDGQRLQRCYTIASAPNESGRLTITVKRVPGGPVSTWLHEHLRVGDVVRAAGPFGTFSTTTHPAAKYLFLSAGSGITPVMSMTRALADGSDRADVDIAFVHCARSPQDIIFREELAGLAARGEAAVTILCEDDSPDESWQGPRGRISMTSLFPAVPDLLDREIFTCGPPPFMAAVREVLETMGADPARCHEESFVLGGGRGDAPTTGDPQQVHRVTFRRSGRTIECDGATPVLTAATRAGLRLPSSCGEGVCGTCKTTLVSGRVDMPHGGGIRQREIDQGKVLLCCSRPLGDLDVDA